MFAQASASLLFLSTLTPLVWGHGFVEKIWFSNPVSEYDGWSPNQGPGVPYPNNIPAWFTTNQGGNPLYANASLSDQIVCAKGGAPAQFLAPAAPGSTISVKWGQGGFPPGHWGPIIDYIAPCDGPCANILPANLKFVKIAQRGWINEGSGIPGYWATNEMITNNNIHNIQLPSNLKPGEYVVRHELIALHIADRAIGKGPYYTDGPEFYPQCISIVVGGSGTKAATGGKAAKDLYRGEEPGLAINIYTSANHADYVFPGPPLWT